MNSSNRLLWNVRALLTKAFIQRAVHAPTTGEARIALLLKEKFPQATSLKVVDISGGCGAMYEIHIESEEFKGKRTIQQHQLVNQALKEEIKSMHGLRIFTSIPQLQQTN
ncbi:bolA-like protein 3 [Polypterus senegalus]|uniref:bolA-like protein 3 n=1 Tax=Polypterus senegalus TaxID=55291 RepID=UPI001964036A|nr:bolA-like protein 3 [Polypterus senegalus]